MQSDVWGSYSESQSISSAITHLSASDFSTNATTVNGWLRNFLWSFSTQVIQSYGTELADYGLVFLLAHFLWAFSLMFLFSGRGYWQELIEAIVYAHYKLKIVAKIQPRALTITHGRAAGLTHYLIGGIGTTNSFILARMIRLN
jgi:photosystem I P700 chlorophyll a apoprotein A1